MSEPTPSPEPELSIPKARTKVALIEAALYVTGKPLDLKTLGSVVEFRSEDKIRELADGRVYSGEQAKGLGLVDLLGNMEDAIDLAGKRGGIKGAPQVIHSRSEEKSWWEKLLFSFFGSRLSKSESWGLRYEWSPAFIQ